MTDREELQSELMEQCRLLGMSAERELKLLAGIEQARRTAEYWKSEHIAANVENERLRAEIDEIKQVEFPRRVQKVADVWRGKVDTLRAEIERQKARYALLEESYSMLRAEIDEMKRQKPAAWLCPDDPDSATAFSWRPVACETASCLKRRVPLYLAPGAQGVPDGWKSVPVEPTLEMLHAAQTAWLKDPCRKSSTIYRAMVAAAPGAQENNDG